MVRRRGAAVILVEFLWVGARGPIPKTADPRHLGPHFGGPVVEKHKADTGRHHQALLAPGDHDIDAPAVHLEDVTTERRNAIGHQQRRMIDRIQRRAHARNIIAHRRRGIDMHRQHGLDFMGSIGLEPVGDLVQIHGGLLAEIHHLDIGTQPGRRVTPAMTKAARCGHQHLVTGRDHIAQRCFPRRVTVADIHRHMMLRARNIAQPLHQGRHHIHQRARIDVRSRTVHRIQNRFGHDRRARYRKIAPPV